MFVVNQVRNDASTTKMERQIMIAKKIAATFNANPKDPIFLRKLVIWVEMSIGLTRRRAEEYIAVVVDSHDDWVIEDGALGPEIKQAEPDAAE